MKYFIGGLVGLAAGVAIMKMRAPESFCCGKVKDGITEKLQDKLGDTAGGLVGELADRLGLMDAGISLWDTVEGA